LRQNNALNGSGAAEGVPMPQSKGLSSTQSNVVTSVRNEHAVADNIQWTGPPLETEALGQQNPNMRSQSIKLSGDSQKFQSIQCQMDAIKSTVALLMDKFDSMN